MAQMREPEALSGHLQAEATQLTGRDMLAVVPRTMGVDSALATGTQHRDPPSPLRDTRDDMSWPVSPQGRDKKRCWWRLLLQPPAATPQKSLDVICLPPAYLCSPLGLLRWAGDSLTW
jgi:hypothetical protein